MEKVTGQISEEQKTKAREYLMAMMDLDNRILMGEFKDNNPALAKYREFEKKVESIAKENQMTLEELYMLM